eukprot:5849221-Prymnesium_polylepis.1
MASPCGRPTAKVASRALDGKRQKRCLPIPPILERLRVVRRRLARSSPCRPTPISQVFEMELLRSASSP